MGSGGTVLERCGVRTVPGGSQLDNGGEGGGRERGTERRRGRRRGGERERRNVLWRLLEGLL